MFKHTLIFLTVFSLYGCETLQNLDKGLYAATNTITQKDKITGKRVISNTREEQIAQGNAIMEQLIASADSEGLKYNTTLNPKAYNRLVQIFEKIHSVSHLKNEEWTLILIDDDSFNAFVTGGTYIVVHSGLENQLTDDSEIAAVIGHEFAHVVANHMGERQAHHKLASLAGSKSASRASFKTAYTHENEEEADEIGILYASLSGYDPYAAHRLWNKKYQQEGDYASSFVSHPVNSERAKKTQMTAKDVARYYVPGEINPAHEEIIKTNSLYTYREDPALQAGKGGGVFAALSTSLESYQKHLNAKNEEKRQVNRIAKLKAINELLTVTAIDQVSTNKWRFTVKYRGNKNIGKLVFNARLFQNKKELTILSARSTGYYAPGGSYYVMALAEHAVPLKTKISGYHFKVTEAVVY